MKLLSSFGVCLATFYYVTVITTVNCDAQASQNENSEQPQNSSVIQSQYEAANESYVEEIGKLVQLLQENFGQLTRENQQVSRRHETLDVSDDDSKNEQLPSTSNLHPRVTDLKQGDSDKLNQRSAFESEEDDTPEGSKSTSQLDKKSTLQERIANPFDIFTNVFLDNVDKHPQPIRNILDFIMDRLTPKLNREDQQSKKRFPRKLFERTKNVLSEVKETTETLSPVGIHRTLKLGPWSVSFDMGKP
ncbi:uncharacterized protein LOC114871719 [Osmia bicornis bicornis]|uniref:uncharacterized protein LOC114871719 n=1 Tax=Osmia bicornis bicornis TaxID=1437191 RepID=UPI001EAE991A|nr:uncharacterized protein LOC114871719 [Osmia bicornis bicornis]